METDRPEADGIRILFATDFHLRKRQDADAIASQLAEIDCDLRLYGGDFADRREDSLRMMHALSKVKAPLGVFAVPGNNDSEAFGDDWATMEAALDAPMLVNRSVQAGPLIVGGVDEYYHGKPSDEGLFATDGFSVLLSHYPILPKHCRPNLMLSGHTHGGQFNCLGLTPYSIGFEQLGKKRRPAPARIEGLAKMGETS
ncbi:MAG: metallophosphoesterase, partial [Clostridia bacterium]|nr:metallophosphoesterase [Clostridia bacterium]